MDDMDTCPDTPSGQTVDSNGCSDSQKDTDGDGVTDDLDTCSETPEGEDVDENGCSDSQKDTDGDGVTDDVDLCPDTPSGQSVDENGCSESERDTDGDGVLDSTDNCINYSNPNQEDFDNDGIGDFCDNDIDGDEVLNEYDYCNDTVNGRPINQFGCQNPMYLDDNGVTIKSHEWGQVGDLGMVDGNWYIVVDNDFWWNQNNHKIIDHLQGTSIDLITGDSYMVLKNNSRIYYVKMCTSKITKLNSDNNIFYNGYNGSPYFVDLTYWDVSNVTDMSWFFNSTGFDGDVSNWDVSNVTNMESLFSNSQFNGDISNWDVSSVTNMSNMFRRINDTQSFNGDISNWDVSSVTDMRYMFIGSQFNGDISNWDVSSVTNMSNMFRSNYIFNQNLSSWNVSNVTNCVDFSHNTPQWTLPKPNFTNCNPN